MLPGEEGKRQRVVVGQHPPGADRRNHWNTEFFCQLFERPAGRYSTTTYHNDGVPRCTQTFHRLLDQHGVRFGSAFTRRRFAYCHLFSKCQSIWCHLEDRGAGSALGHCTERILQQFGHLVRMVCPLGPTHHTTRHSQLVA